MGSEEETTMETVVIVRPIKVIGMLVSAFALLMMVLAVAASAWVEADRVREGLWERCPYRPDEADMVDCEENTFREWLRACQGLLLLAMALTFVGVVLVSLGLRGENAGNKVRLYLAGVGVWVAAVVVQVLALIIYAVKFLGEIEEKAEVQWQFGWSYGLSWTAAVCILAGAILVFVDRRAVEIEEREITVQKEGFEEEQASEEAV
ncbi:transmembrane protein 47-like [Babylonia areolata]|uniref:transmembrane protein 47-like n=1 Tax=Babylonia areolata TaxID=304850 RepID=UPI003FD66BFA